MSVTPRALAHSAIAPNSACEYTAPVGFDGDEMISPFVLAVAAASRSSGVSRKSRRSLPATGTGSALAKVTISGYEVQYGAPISTSSPGPKRQETRVEERLLRAGGDDHPRGFGRKCRARGHVFGGGRTQFRQPRGGGIPRSALLDALDSSPGNPLRGSKVGLLPHSG